LSTVALLYDLIRASLSVLDAERGFSDERALDAARLLDRHYIPTLYPDNLPDGAPTDFYRVSDADDAIAAAEVILAHSRR
jgi:HEPN domain-containing protein